MRMMHIDAFVGLVLLGRWMEGGIRVLECERVSEGGGEY